MSVAALALASGTALASDLQSYKDMFEPLPYLPPIPADNSMTREKIELGNTPVSPLDRFLRGDVKAMTEQQVEGMKLFVDAGCVACHNGPALTDNKFHRFNLPVSTGAGRFLVIGNEAVRFAFRTQTLRNVAMTYRYFINNSSVAELRGAVQLMGEQMLGRDFSELELDQLEAFMHALTGDIPRVEMAALP